MFVADKQANTAAMILLRGEWFESFDPEGLSMIQKTFTGFREFPRQLAKPMVFIHTWKIARNFPQNRYWGRNAMGGTCVLFRDLLQWPQCRAMSITTGLKIGLCWDKGCG